MKKRSYANNGGFKNKARLIVGLLIAFNIWNAGIVKGQNKYLTLDSCYKLAKANFPLIQQKGIIDQLEHNAIEGLNKNWLPKLSLYSSAVYQSEVTSFNVNIPGFAGLFPTIPKDQYTNAIELEQIIFDAGQLKQQKALEKLNSENEKLKNEVELYKLVDRVNQMYSGVLLGRANLKTLRLYQENLQNRRVLVGAAVNNGLLLESNWDELEVETLKTEQQVIEAKEGLKALYASMKLLTNVAMDDSTHFALIPLGGSDNVGNDGAKGLNGDKAGAKGLNGDKADAKGLNGDKADAKGLNGDKAGAKGDGFSRPELKMFDTQKNILDARKSLSNKLAMPQLAFIGEGVYGRPGYDFLSVDPHFFGKVGVTLKWNISALYSLNNEKQKYELGKSSVDVQQQLFILNIKTALEDQAAHVNSLQQMIDSDKAISAKRHNITLSAASQLENGSLTTADYLIQLNAEMQALLNQQIHEIKLMNAITTYQTTKGISNY